MRGRLLLLFALLLAGCTRPPEAPETTATPTPSAGPINASAALPSHPVGRAWTFEGTELYNEDAAFTVVVASADADGYLFAGGAEDDLVHEALWGSPWFGSREPDLDRKGWYMTPLDFPIHDGKTWAFDEQVRVTARAGDVETPTGREPGFTMSGDDGSGRTVSYDYAPSLGQIVRWMHDYGNGRGESVRMTAVAEGRPWVWYELGTLVVVPNPHEPQPFDVPAGYDAVIASAGGVRGSRAVLAPPQGQPWTTEFTGPDEDWHHALLPAAEGRWGAAVAGRPDVDAPAVRDASPVGWAYMHVAPVRWVRG